jgi:hypothetical protein
MPISISAAAAAVVTAFEILLAFQAKGRPVEADGDRCVGHEISLAQGFGGGIREQRPALMSSSTRLWSAHRDTEPISAPFLVRFAEQHARKISHVNITRTLRQLFIPE